jgi:hypothetical protein
MLSMSSDKGVLFSPSLCFHPNGSNADKAPFLNLTTVQPATRLSSLLCAINYLSPRYRDSTDY